VVEDSPRPNDQYVGVWLVEGNLNDPDALSRSDALLLFSGDRPERCINLRDCWWLRLISPPPWGKWGGWVGVKGGWKFV